MKTSVLLLSIPLATSSTAAFAQHGADGAHPQASAAQASPAPKLQGALRGLWLGHVNATRDYALAVRVSDRKKAQRAERAVVSNAKQISGAVAGFYGSAAGDRLLSLLAGHWGAVKAITDAEKAKDKAGHARAIETLTIGNRIGREDARELLSELGASLGSADPIPEADSDQEIAQGLAERLSRAGYEAVATNRGGSAQVEAFNCVFHSLARANSDVCRFDIASWKRPRDERSCTTSASSAAATCVASS
ncbi:MAG: hypothetical protein M3Q40_08460 [Pseudomonadota bacterium]|nr:hypothetical protein [Pseudomonadota bacterium]